MARKGPRTYKITNVNTKNMGSAGGQYRVRDIDKIDNQSTANGFVKSVKLSVIFDTEQGAPGAGIIAYATTDNVWSDDYVISSAAVGSGGGTLWLNLWRYIKTGADTPLQGQSGGPIYIWLEITDPGATSESLRIVSEVYGANVTVTEV